MILRIEQSSIASLEDVVVLNPFSRDVHGGSKKMKHPRVVISYPLFERTGQPARLPTRKHMKTFVNI